MKKTYVDIILPLALPQSYSYEVPTALLPMIAVGKRVEVQFGAKRIYAGIVQKIIESEPPSYPIKPILNVLDEEPILTVQQLRFWKWMAAYYMSTEGEVMNTALPSAFKLSSETKIYLNPSFTHDFSLLNDNEYLITEALTIHKDLSIESVQDILDKKKVYFIVKSLLEKGVILIKEQLIARYKPKVATFIRLAAAFEKEEKLQELFQQLKVKAPKRTSILLAYLQLQKQKKQDFILQKTVLDKANASASVLKGMVAKNIFVAEKKTISRLTNLSNEEIILYDLTPHQADALEKIEAHFKQKSVVLLHGITSSGKTQIYIKLIKNLLEQGKQVLYLLPEIALTSQMIARLRKVFGQKIGVYHSKFNDQERIEIWQKTLQKDYQIVVGPRSALFLPFSDLGLIIVDEEHDSSFKQIDPSPRYHARDAAICLAAICGAKTILGSATPSLESYYNATTAKKYGLVTLSERYGGVQSPKLQLVNMKQEAREKNLKASFSGTLITALKTALGQGEQAIIFQNRRGYAPFLVCDACGSVPQCYQCDVSLTYHKYSNQLKCHYCGYKKQMVMKCDACQSTYLKIKGLGTEKVEDELKIFLPDIKTGRLDLETAKTKKGFEQVIGKFEAQEIDVLVGTQMVTKGLDFDNVSIVGIVSADQLLNFPDFRAAERAFQLILQVSGRAGRRQKQGKVLIQTLNANYQVLNHVINGDYLSFFGQEIQERRRFAYPPFKRLIQMTLKHPSPEIVNEAAFVLSKNLKDGLDQQIIGPSIPMVSRVRNFYLRQIIVKLDKSAKKIAHTKQIIQQNIVQLKKDKNYRTVIVQLDVDPQ